MSRKIMDGIGTEWAGDVVQKSGVCSHKLKLAHQWKLLDHPSINDGIYF